MHGTEILERYESVQRFIIHQHQSIEGIVNDTVRLERLFNQGLLHTHHGARYRPFLHWADDYRRGAAG